MVNCLALLVNQLCAGSYCGALQTTASGSKKRNKKNNRNRGRGESLPVSPGVFILSALALRQDS